MYISSYSLSIYMYTSICYVIHNIYVCVYIDIHIHTCIHITIDVEFKCVWSYPAWYPYTFYVTFVIYDAFTLWCMTVDTLYDSCTGVTIMSTTCVSGMHKQTHHVSQTTTFVSSEIMKCRLLKWLLDHTTTDDIRFVVPLAWKRGIAKGNAQKLTFEWLTTPKHDDNVCPKLFLSQEQNNFRTCRPQGLTVRCSAKAVRNRTTTPEGRNFGRNFGCCFL